MSVIAKQDRYGLPIRTAICLDCGLIYLLDKLTSQGYAGFYENGYYRRLIAAFKGKAQTVQRVQAAQVNYTAGLLAFMRGFLTTERGACMLDVGGSTGLVAHEFVRRYGYQATVLDPSPLEVEASRSLDLNAVVGSIESWDDAKRYDLVLLCRTLEHLFDLRKALTNIHRLLKPEGLLYCDIADFMEVCRREGPPEATSKIDHAYWFTQETAVPFFRSLGFETVAINTILPPDQVGFLLRKGAPSSLRPVSFEWIQAQIRRLREIRSDWRQYGRQPLDVRDWFKQRAYTIKKKKLV